MSEIISQEEARRRLGEDVVIGLEPKNEWVFDIEKGAIRRTDGRFHDGRVVQHPGGWYVLAIHEEPNTPEPSDGSHRIVGHTIVDLNPRGLVRVRTNKGLNGTIQELKPSSLSKGELESEGRAPDAVLEANPQRLTGFIAVYLNRVEFDDTEGMTPGEFVSKSTDGRSISALAKLKLL